MFNVSLHYKVVCIFFYIFLPLFLFSFLSFYCVYFVIQFVSLKWEDQKELWNLCKLEKKEKHPTLRQLTVNGSSEHHHDPRSVLFYSLTQKKVTALCRYASFSKVCNLNLIFSFMGEESNLSGHKRIFYK